MKLAYNAAMTDAIISKLSLCQKPQNDDYDDDELYFSVRSSSWPCKAY